MILKYNSFLSERLLENMVNESRIYFSPKLTSILSTKLFSNDDITKDIMEIIGTDIKPDITFVDVSDNSGYITFSQLDNAMRAIKSGLGVSDDNYDTFKKSFNDIGLSDSLIRTLFTDTDINLMSKSRNEMKLGKFINTLLPGKYTAKQVEDFVNKYKGCLSGDAFDIKIVEGEDIIKYYNHSKYFNKSGTLGNSCMRKDRCGDYFGIYVNNPEVCRLVILKSKYEDLIYGRALVWKLDSSEVAELIGSTSKSIGKSDNPVYFMDRVYGVDDTILPIFHKYADDNGWLKKLFNSYADTSNFKFGDEEYHDMTVTVKLNKFDFKYYPYMDTFKKLICKTGILVNTDDDKEPDCFILEGTEGDDFIDTNNVWSEFYDKYIPISDSIWSEWYDSHIIKSESVEVVTGTKYIYLGHYPDPENSRSSNSVVFDKYLNEYINKKDATYSEYEKTYIYSPDVVDVIVRLFDDFEYVLGYLSIKSDNIVKIDDIRCHEYLKLQGIKYDFEKSLLGGDKENGYWIKSKEIKVYSDGKGGFYSEFDCKILGIETSDEFEYTDSIDYDYNMSDKTKEYLIDLYENKLDKLGDNDNSDLKMSIVKRLTEML